MNPRKLFEKVIGVVSASVGGAGVIECRSGATLSVREGDERISSRYTGSSTRPSHSQQERNLNFPHSEPHSEIYTPFPHSEPRERNLNFR